MADLSQDLIIDPSEASAVEEMPKVAYAIPSTDVKKGIGIDTTAFFIVAEIDRMSSL